MLLRHLTLLVLMNCVAQGKTKLTSMLHHRQTRMKSPGLDAFERLIIRLKRVPDLNEDGGSRATDMPTTTTIVPNTPPSPPVPATDAVTTTTTNTTTTTSATTTNTTTSATTTTENNAQPATTANATETTTLMHNPDANVATRSDNPHITCFYVLPLIATFKLLCIEMI